MFDESPTPNSALVQLALANAFTEIADMSPSDVSTFSEQQRFKTIKAIKDSVLEKSPPPEDDPSLPVCEETFATEIAALIRISETMRHSHAYNNWLEACRSLLVYKLYNNRNYMRFSQKWEKRDIALRQSAHQIRERLHTQSANRTFKPIFSNSTLAYFVRPRREDSDPARCMVTNGSAVGEIDNQEHSIKLNTHEDSSFRHAPSSNATAHHEKVHNLGIQLGRYYAAGAFDKIGEQCHDAMLWFHLKKEKAVISPRIQSAYRAQFHEIVAFAEGDKMSESVRAMLRPGFKVEKPNLPYN